MCSGRIIQQDLIILLKKAKIVSVTKYTKVYYLILTVNKINLIVTAKIQKSSKQRIHQIMF